MALNSRIAKLITNNAATHSNLMKKMSIPRKQYYEKLRGEVEFTDFELLQIASLSTLKIGVLRKAVGKK